MIKKEDIEKDLVHYYSDSGFRIIKENTGQLYDDAVELRSTDVTYIETDIPIESDLLHDEATIADYQRALQSLGVEINE